MTDEPEKTPVPKVWDSLTNVERAAILLMAADVDADEQIDVAKLSVLYDGLPIHTLASNADARTSEPFLRAIVAIDRAAREGIVPFEALDRITALGEDGLSTLLARARAELHPDPRCFGRQPLLDGEDDCGEWVPIMNSEHPVPAMGTCRYLVQPHDAFMVTHLAVTIPASVAEGLTISVEGVRRILVDRVSALLFVVRVPEDSTEPIERGAQIEPSWIYPSIPLKIDVHNHSSANARFSASARGRYPAKFPPKNPSRPDPNYMLY